MTLSNLPPGQTEQGTQVTSNETHLQAKLLALSNPQ